MPSFPKHYHARDELQDLASHTFDYKDPIDVEKQTSDLKLRDTRTHIMNSKGRLLY